MHNPACNDREKHNILPDFAVLCGMTKEKENPWTLLEAKEQYDNPWITVTEHQVVKPRGGKGIYGVVHFKNKAIGVVALDDEDHIYLVGQFRYPLNKYSWEIPEGGGPHNEDPLLAAKRELLEETGLTAASWKPLLEMDLSNSVSDESCQVFVATGLSRQEAQPEDTEVLQIKRIPFEEAVSLVLSGEITDAISVAAMLKLKTLRELNQRF